MELEKYNSRPIPRKVNELEYEELEDVPKEDISEIDRASDVVCWNCRKKGHRFTDCLDERSIFCVGCGAENIYKPNCINCQNQGNGRASGFRSMK